MLKKLLGDTVIYGASSILGRALNYFLVPLHTSIFLPDQYGIITEFYAYVAFLNVIFTYGMETAFFRFAGKKQEEQVSIFNRIFTSILLSTVLLGGSLYYFSQEIALALGYPDEYQIIQWIVLILSLDTLVAVPFAQLRLQGKATRFAIFRVSSILINIGLNLFFLVICPHILNSPQSVFHELISENFQLDFRIILFVNTF